jgi:hypothetical protein
MKKFRQKAIQIVHREHVNFHTHLAMHCEHIAENPNEYKPLEYEVFAVKKYLGSLIREIRTLLKYACWLAVQEDPKGGGRVYPVPESWKRVSEFISHKIPGSDPPWAN